MSKINIERINKKMIELGENPITLKKLEYDEPIIKDGYLLDEDGNKIGTKGDMYTKKIMHKILQEGYLDNNPRPHYEEDFYQGATYDEKENVIIKEDGTKIKVGPKESAHVMEGGVMHWFPAHTLSINDCEPCVYDLSKGESPVITLRPTAIRRGIAEVLWIYQKESNDLVVFDELLGNNTWDQDHKIHNWWLKWALRDKNGNFILNEKGHPIIGSTYGEIIRRRHMLREEVIDSIKKDPDGRRHITCMWQIDDFKEPHGLKPCAFETHWNVRHEWDGKDYLDMTLIQRSSDFATAGCINQTQYTALLKMVAKELCLIPGKFIWKATNVQLYDRHLDQAVEMLNRKPFTCGAEISIINDKDKFDDFVPEDFKVIDYPREDINKKNYQLKFPLGV